MNDSIFITIALHGDNDPFVVERDEVTGKYVYYFIANNGSRSTKYRNLRTAQLDIKQIYGDLEGFKLLDIPGEILNAEGPPKVEDASWTPWNEAMFYG